MSADLERLLYASTAARPTDSLLNLAEILAVSQRNNDRDGLTGALAVHEGRFIQVVEGRSDALNSLLARLKTDARHRDIRIIDRQPVAARQFGQWSMASARITPDLQDALDAVMADSGADAERLVERLKAAAG
jgi:hypothetical protein